MAKNNISDLDTIDEPPIEHDQLEAVALELYSKSNSTANRGFDPEQVAKESFKRAKAFLLVSAGVRAGAISADPDKPLPHEDIEVPVWQEKADGKWEPVIDPVTRKPVTQKVLVDRECYAPNLPVDHPINRRFKPIDGPGIEDRISKFKSDRLAFAEPVLN